MLIIGSHVSFGTDQLLGSVKEAISYGANAFMFYTGAPQNTVRKSIDESKTLEARALMKEECVEIENVVCHAPYIINLANNKDMDKYKFSIEFLINELDRCRNMGIKTIVLHPGSSVGLDKNVALKNIIYGLNLVLESNSDVVVCLETMAGKGTEVGASMDEVKTIIDGIKNASQIGVCLDTCHLSDSGVDIEKFDEYLEEFNAKIGIDKIRVVHINDSKNPIGSHKDRHENIGFGTIGFETLNKVIYNPRLENVPKILETPYVGESDTSKERLYPPYKFEIDMIRKRKFDRNLLDDIRKYYRR